MRNEETLLKRASSVKFMLFMVSAIFIFLDIIIDYFSSSSN